MLNYLKALYHIILNYRFFTIQILLDEIYFNFKYDKNLNQFKYLKSNFLSDSIPCPYFFLKKIKSFVEKKDIRFICDLGSGYGKVLYFFGEINKYKIDGVELDKDIFNHNILDFNFNSKEYDLFILNDPLKQLGDLNILIKKIKSTRKNHYLVFINLTPDKTNLVNSSLEIIESFIISQNKNIYFTRIINNN
jgi:hypothetical protein